MAGVPIDPSGRTEDVRFSPSGNLLALVATDGRILLFDVDIGSHPVRILRHTELRSTSLASPHGIDFLSEDVVVVANRGGSLTFHRLPPTDAWEQSTTVEPVHRTESGWFGAAGSTRKLRERSVACGPGSVRAYGGELYVCCNNASTVTVHPYRMHDGVIETGDARLAAQQGLELPDGVALSRDGRWMAVSDHDHHRVVVYRRGDPSGSCVLRDPDLHFPHGLCFDPTGRRLYVADAGGALVQVFIAAGGWVDDADSAAGKVVAVGDDVMQRTRATIREEYRALEGGIKGIDVDPSGRMVATTCRHQLLRFFEVPSTPVD